MYSNDLISSRGKDESAEGGLELTPRAYSMSWMRHVPSFLGRAHLSSLKNPSAFAGSLFSGGTKGLHVISGQKDHFIAKGLMGCHWEICPNPKRSTSFLL
jgi:hypothetical protein